MKKKYSAKTGLGINIVLKGGGNMHVAFTPVSGGGSVFYTDDPEVQKGLERHYKFGKLFVCKEIVEPTPKQSAAGLPDEQPQGPANTVKQVRVTDWESAKEYLVDNCGLMRTKLKTQTAIKAAAEAKGIEFVFEA